MTWRRLATGLAVAGATAVFVMAIDALAAGSPAYPVPPPLDRTTLALNPTQGPPNGTITFSGTGFCATAGCGPVSVSFAGTPVASGITPDSTGAIRGTFDVPPSPAGSQRVVASQPRASRSATALFSVAPNLPLPPTPKASTTFTPASASPPIREGSTPDSATPISAPATIAGTTDESGARTPATDRPRAVAGNHGGTGPWPWIGLGALVVAAALAAALYARRRSRSTPVHGGRDR